MICEILKTPNDFIHRTRKKGGHFSPYGLGRAGDDYVNSYKRNLKMIKLYSPENESELALIKSLFELEHISYYVLNDHFGTMKVGPKIDLLNVKTIYVSEEDLNFAKDILLDFLENTKNVNKPFKSQYSIPDKIRMVIETLVFSWFIPGNRWNRNKKEENV